MSLINAYGLLGDIRTFRVAWFGGRFGGGKTSLAFRVAYDLMKGGQYRYLLTNCRSPWADNPADVVLRDNPQGLPQYADTVIILDEGGLFLHYSQDANEFLAFLRKLNIVLLIPSYDEPARKLKGLTVQRVMNMQAMGLPAWVYDYQLRYGRQREKQTFVWWMPSEVYGVYDSSAAPIDDNGISAWMADLREIIVEREKAIQEKQGNRNRAYVERSTVARKLPQMEGFGRDAGEFSEAAGELVDTLSILDERSGKRRR